MSVVRVRRVLVEICGWRFYATLQPSVETLLGPYPLQATKGEYVHQQSGKEKRSGSSIITYVHISLWRPLFLFLFIYYLLFFNPSLSC
jgi:hypothetical protein